MTPSPLHLDGIGQAEMIARGDIKPSELLELAIAAAESLNPQLNAIIRPMYKEAHAAIASGLPKGIFHGVPFLLKDGVASYKGVPTSLGSKVFAQITAQRDSELVARYKKAGLVIFGKTNMPELGLLPVTEPADFGPSRNPWNTTKTPGGSSGGTAAAVAARIVAMAHGNDGGGSIRIPAACCGLFGLKPTRGRNPLGPAMSEVISGLVEEHVLTRSVRDSAAMLDATAGTDVGAWYSAPPKKASFLSEIGNSPGHLKIGYSLKTPNGREIEPEVAAKTEEAIKLLEQLGHTLVETPLPQTFDGKMVGKLFGTIWAVGGTTALSLVERMTGKEPDENQFEPLTLELYKMAKNITAAEYEMARLAVHRIARSLGELFKDIDVWLSPTLGELPVDIGEFAQSKEDPMKPFKRASGFGPFTALFNVSGQPAASVPLFQSDSGLPIGIQLVGRFGDEATLFRLSAQLERERPWIHRLPKVLVS